MRKKTGGRKKGTPNRTTRDTRQLISKLVNDEIKHIMTNIHQLELRDRCYFLSKLLPYVAPKMMSIAHQTGKENGQLIEVHFTSTDIKLPTSEAEAEQQFNEMSKK